MTDNFEFRLNCSIMLKGKTAQAYYDAINEHFIYQGDDPLLPKPHAHQEAIAKLIEEYPDLAGRQLYTRYLDICPAFISQETFERFLTEVKSGEP